ncbi:Von Willebrand factor type A domain protein [Arcticibacter svalbardensis MN12-7]|uniref:von Willebrand factor type A domain protein n=1 Tax=Arcticibacter svalbardensis MN12-7 TaxID=1150600 RepID=R9GS81_9SPHI|nr:VWA domain-containing protein [Arcticibacter svalbardensis]EOR94420.1 Von Willebrand factor type A domain protein [Arcticibacter svalbardensis MN12-7]
MKTTIALTSFLAFMLLIGFKTSQTIKVSGMVTSTQNLNPLSGVQVTLKNTRISTQTDAKGKYTLEIPAKGSILQFAFIGYKKVEIKYTGQRIINVAMEELASLTEVVVTGYGKQENKSTPSPLFDMNMNIASVQQGRNSIRMSIPRPVNQNTETYATVNENRFTDPRNTPLSTFGIDVDAASYSNVRRFINQGQLPPTDAVRIEEMINYFAYDYPQPTGNQPFSVNTELAAAPWNPQHRLLRIGLQGKKMDTANIPASNIVLLIDVSGSMNDYNKLPLVKSSLKMLVNQLRPKDYVSIVTYAGSASIALKPISGNHKAAIKDAIDNLEANGSTAGGAGLTMAYDLASKHFIKRGNNRVIMATDGDFNIGESSDAQMQHLIEAKRNSGVFLSVLGFGMGNIKDSKMETLADKGNGHYAYIDNISEGRKVLVTEFGGTLFTLAKDVKLQLEFNPAYVQAYRLIGYENRLLNKEDFNNDQKDAGDLGAGHSVTALYEIIPAGLKSKFLPSIDPLKYQLNKKLSYAGNQEMVTIKLRYKSPDGDKSKLISTTVADTPVLLKNASTDFRFAAAVAGYGMLLKKSEFIQHGTYQQSAALASSSIGPDNEGFRSEFVRLVKASSLLAEDLLSSTQN